MRSNQSDKRPLIFSSLCLVNAVHYPEALSQVQLWLMEQESCGVEMQRHRTESAHLSPLKGLFPLQFDLPKPPDECQRWAFAFSSILQVIWHEPRFPETPAQISSKHFACWEGIDWLSHRLWVNIWMACMWKCGWVDGMERKMLLSLKSLLDQWSSPNLCTNAPFHPESH